MWFGLRGPCQGQKGVSNERVVLIPAHFEPWRPFERDVVAEVEALENGHDLMLAVGAPRSDDERKVDLGRCKGPHLRAFASATNSEGSSASARMLGSRSIAVSASTARSRCATPASSSEFGSVFRR